MTAKDQEKMGVNLGLEQEKEGDIWRMNGECQSGDGGALNSLESWVVFL